MTDESVDVLILGAGAAGLTAALASAAAGARVRVLERSDRLGGSAAVSAGIVWVPCNRHAVELAGDTTDAADAYLRKGAGPRGDGARIEHFVRTGPAMVDFLREDCGVPFQPLDYPDFYPDLEGARLSGRSLETALFDSGELADPSIVRKRAAQHPAVLISERGRVGDDERARRIEEGVWATGGALAGHLVRACLARGVEFVMDARARRLLVEDGRVTGVVAEIGAAGPGETELRASGGVVIATGGFEWNRSLMETFLHPPIVSAVSPPVNEGDGLLMAMDAGAALGEMAEAWWTPMIAIESDQLPGGSVYIPAVGERARRHCVIVNRDGRRFVNEASNYTDIAVAMQQESNPARFANDPAWIVTDADCPAGGLFGGLVGEQSTWLPAYGSLRELAEKEQIDAEGLIAEIDHFNEMARRGRDIDFGRGDSPYDVYLGDGAAPDATATLAPVETPPFYAIPLFSGTFGTHGGPRIDEHSRVLDGRGVPIAGLFAAGNAAAGMFGSFYPGPGATLGAALHGGYWAGRSAAGVVLGTDR